MTYLYYIRCTDWNPMYISSTTHHLLLHCEGRWWWAIDGLVHSLYMNNVVTKCAMLKMAFEGNWICKIFLHKWMSCIDRCMWRKFGWFWLRFEKFFWFFFDRKYVMECRRRRWMGALRRVHSDKEWSLGKLLPEYPYKDEGIVKEC